MAVEVGVAAKAAADQAELVGEKNIAEVHHHLEGEQVALGEEAAEEVDSEEQEVVEVGASEVAARVAGAERIVRWQKLIQFSA